MPAPEPRSIWRERLALVLVLVAAVVLLVEREWLWRWDNVAYDVLVDLWPKEPPDDVVIVAIDELSLSAIGSWPWPRSVHAELVERLREEGAGTIGIDVVFANPDSRGPDNDELLAAELAAAGNVVLALMHERPLSGGQLFELLPEPGLSEAAASLAHVHVELDPDGLARSVYLRAGLGKALWPAFALAVLEQEAGTPSHTLPGLRNPDPGATMQVWVRDYWVRVPFIGPPDTFNRVSYINVLTGEHQPDIFRDKTVLVGITAVGLGDSLPTPVSGHEQRMSGIEFHANALQALREGTVITPASPQFTFTVSIVLALLPVLIYPLLGPRRALIAAGVLSLTPALLALALLHGARLWFGPAPATLVLAASYPLWSWLRLESALRYLSGELERAREEQDSMPEARRPPFEQAMNFLSTLYPLKGGVLVDEENQIMRQIGEMPATPAPKLNPGQLKRVDNTLWCCLFDRGQLWRIGTAWGPPEGPSNAELEQLRSLLSIHAGPIRRRPPRGAAEVVQAHIEQLQYAIERIRTLRRVTTESFAQMADGVLVVNTLGHVVVSNPRAGAYLTTDPQAEIAQQPIVELLATVEIESGARSWVQAIRRVMIEREHVTLNARSQNGRDLLIHMAPLKDAEERLRGFVTNVADISALKQSERKRAEMLSFLSHDLRSPLTSALAVIELSREEEEKKAIRSGLDRIEQHTRRTLDLTEGFLELTRAEDGSGVELAELELAGVVSSAVDEVADQARGKQARVELQVELEGARVRGDDKLLRRVFVNLIGNALKYGPEGATVNVVVSNGERNGEYVVRVTDHGPGIAEEDRRRLFERFQRGRHDLHNDPAGTGLGLAFVKAATDLHSGRVEVRSQLGQGSEFAVFLAAS
ncbi:MAG: CHASE2 domain-containing protein [Gammaproteobacteria bacterium]